MAQSVHAAFQFSEEHPELCRSWMRDSRYLVVLSAPNEHELMRLASRAVRSRMNTSLVQEPDLDYQLTAIALEPGGDARKLCANLPLALRDRVTAMPP